MNGDDHSTAQVKEAIEVLKEQAKGAGASAPARPTKIPAVRVPSDSCTIEYDGEEVQVHVGEWVDVLPVMSVADIHSSKKLQQLQVLLDAAEGEEDEIAQQVDILDQQYAAVLDRLARRVVGWNWTDLYGKPLPMPDGTAAPFETLSPEETGWLLAAINRDTDDERKNGTPDSPTTSSATKPRRSRTK